MLTILTDEELVRHADLALDPLTSTDLERELLRRLETLLSEFSNLDAVTSVLDAVTSVLADFNLHPELAETAGQLRTALEFADNFEPDQYRPMLDVLAEHDIDTPEALRRVFKTVAEFESIANDAGDTIARLQDLITSTTTTL